MSEITGNGAPLKNTVGKIGDIYTDSNTGEKYKLINIVHLSPEFIQSESTVEYVWEGLFDDVNDDTKSYLGEIFDKSVLDSMAKIEANTQSNKIAGANAVKELAESLDYVELTMDFDVDNATESRLYRTNKTVVIASLKNAPPDCTAGELSIEWKPTIADNSYGSQVAYHTNGNTTRKTHVRYKVGGEWGEWAAYATSDDINKITTQLGSIVYKQIASNETGVHAQCVKDHWETFETNKIYILNVISGSSRIAIVQKYTGHPYGCFLLMGYGLVPEFYSLINGAWTDYGPIALSKSLSNYLPLTGGMLKGNIIPDEDQQRYLGFPNLAWLAMYANNIMLAKNNVNYGHLQVADGTVDAVGAGILVLGNSTLSGNDGNAYGMIRLYNKDSGYTQLTPKADKSVALNFPTKDGTLLCDADKPTGTYTGNGDTTARSIDTGGAGNAVIIWTNDDRMAIITAAGGIGKYSANAELIGLSSGLCSFNDGYINLNTDSPYVNSDGSTYKYQVL